ncbi:helix-turn-helix domain-containing protein [Flavitalea flava]
MKLYIRNMVCNRCITAVRAELELLGLQPVSITLGEVEVEGEISKEVLTRLGDSLLQLGFELIDDRKSRIIEKIKNELVNLVHYTEEQPRTNLSDFLSSKLNHDYNYLSTLFSDVEGITIEKYFIAQKIEKAKELLMYDELTLSEIAFRLGYSSVGYLSNQFKKVTGFTPSHFKTIREKKRIPLDQV